MYKYLNHGRTYALRIRLRNIRAIIFLLLTTTILVIPPQNRFYYFLLVGLSLIMILIEFNRNKKLLFLNRTSLLDYLIIFGTNLYIAGITTIAGGFNSPIAILNVIPTLLFTIELGTLLGVVNLGFLWLLVIISNLFQFNLTTMPFLNSLITVLLATLAWMIIKFNQTIVARYQQKIIRLLFRDDLTGLYNRRYLKSKLLEEILQHHSFYLIMLDINYFKLFNDQWGHSMGDSLLIYVGRILKKVMSENDIVSRISGDEFVIFKPGTSRDSVDLSIEKINKTIEENHFPGEECFPPKKLSLSFGVVNFPEQATGYEELMNEVDRKMYQNKKLRNLN